MLEPGWVCVGGSEDRGGRGMAGVCRKNVTAQRTDVTSSEMRGRRGVWRKAIRRSAGEMVFLVASSLQPRRRPMEGVVIWGLGQHAGLRGSRVGEGGVIGDGLTVNRR